MDLLEAGRRFRLAPELLRLYEENGLLQGVQAPDGTRHYGEEALQRAVSFRFLQQAGMELGTLKHFARLAEQGSDTVGERLRLLRRCRCCLLEEIHQKQQALDQVDYLTRELRGK